MMDEKVGIQVLPKEQSPFERVAAGLSAMAQSKPFFHPILILIFSIAAVALSFFLYIYWYVEVSTGLRRVLDRTRLEPDQVLAAQTWIVILVLSILVGIILLGLFIIFVYNQKTFRLYRLQRNFINNFTHELKTPVASLKLYLETFQKYDLPREDQLKYIGYMVNDADRLTHNINRILVVEDEAHLAEGLKLNLSLKGYEVKTAGNGNAALEQWKAWQPHLMVLDIMLPGIDGLSVLRSIRLEDERLPILILSARGEPDDRVKGFSYGVDDYLAKPFNLDEFLLRVDRLLTRDGWAQEGSDEAEDRTSSLPRVVAFGNNRIDFQTLKAHGPSGEIHLTEQEARLLRLFVANRGKPLSRKKLLEIGWGYTGGTTTRTVDNFVVRLRKYFEPDPKQPVYFKSLRSVRYVFAPPPE